MSEQSQPWVERFRPRLIAEIVGNRSSVDKLVKWLGSWNGKIPKQRAAFLYGPPGTGKTVSVQAAAMKLGYDLMEINASDYRTKDRLDELIGRATLQTVSVFGKRRMILFDEMEGVSGRQDHGGITTIANIIKETRIPVILIASTISENMEEKFRPLRNKCLLIEFKPIAFADLLDGLQTIADRAGVQVDEEVLVTIAMRTGDLRSAINDLESISIGKERVSIEDVEWLGERDQQEYTADVLTRIFSAKTLLQARKAISTSMIRYDDLFDWIYENMPLAMDDPHDLAEGIDALARADIHQNRARSTQAYRLLKYMFDEMTGGVAIAHRRSEGMGLRRQVTSVIAKLGLQQSAFTMHETPEGLLIKPNTWLGREKWRETNEAFRAMEGGWASDGGLWRVPYFRAPQIKWRYFRTVHNRRRMRSIAERVASKCHISSQEAVKEVIPLLRIIFQSDEKMTSEITDWLELEENEAEWLKS